ncbi:MAG TPA: lysophospholipid acyltransferase family protein [Syntrophales bacterium]|nr:lysophospholipid acyltransferase family protein [Syntrophales bacterium]HQA81736.1 lysophospholipid acyltransferase family protein [Syntrophales bacterium]
MGNKARRLLHLQYVLGWVASFFLTPLYYLIIRSAGYSIRNIRDVRRQSRLLFRQHKGPWMVCANHLTMIDSVILAYALFPVYRCVLQYNLLPWNLPERANFQRNFLLTFLCYVNKCVPVSRGGDRGEMKQVLEKCMHLLNEGQNLMIFPEGGRSRTGRVDTQNFSYGVGRFLEGSDNCRVMCLYLRGDHQDHYSNMPRWRENFTCLIDTLEIKKNGQTGLRAQKQYTEQIVRHLSAMEEQYFASGRERCRGFGESRCLRQKS